MNKQNECLDQMVKLEFTWPKTVENGHLGGQQCSPFGPIPCWLWSCCWSLASSSTGSSFSAWECRKGYRKPHTDKALQTCVGNGFIHRIYVYIYIQRKKLAEQGVITSEACAGKSVSSLTSIGQHGMINETIKITLRMKIKWVH